jgi:hypothetical protein
MGLEAFLLGLSNGAVCLAYCAPVLVPCLMGGVGRCGLRSDSLVVLRFLIGRLFGYLLFAVVSWGLGRSLAHTDHFQEALVGSSYLALSIILVFYAFFDKRSSCARSRIMALTGKVGTSPLVLPVAAGLASGLNFCPPFLLALVAGARTGSLQGSLFFFLVFFLGTSLFFIPAPFLGALRRFPAIGIVGKMAAGIIGCYYGYTGLIMLLGGIRSS